MIPPLELVPLGGLGEVGMNCLALRVGDEIVLIDCGVTFADRQSGIDVIHPDFGWLIEHRDQLSAILITHGHEDHIGALPYLLRELEAPIYGPPYSLEQIRHRLSEHELDFEPVLAPTYPGRSFAVGGIEVEPFRVNHSIPDATGLILRTPAGVVVHTGDFKIDADPVDGEAFDIEKLRAVGDAGVRLLLSDSTNVTVDGHTGGEREVEHALLREVERARGRVVVALFASNVDRLRSALAAARATGRKVCLLGRSVGNHSRFARSLGILEDVSGLLIQPEKAQALPRSELMVIATGTQAEPRAALPRMARGAHPHLELEAGDRVILSSRIIPGCETGVSAMIDDLERRGVEVIERRGRPDIHVSGHACRDEQREMLRLVRPASFLPVHGTYRLLCRHAAVAREEGVKDVLVVENGALVELRETGLAKTAEVRVGRVHIDRGEPISDAILKERRWLGELGFAVIVVHVDRDLRPLEPPQITTRGWINEDEEDEFVEEASDYVLRELRRMARDHADADDVRDHARRALKRFCGRWLGRKPLVSALVVES